MSTIAMPTIEEREKLMKPLKPNYSGFTPRPVQKLAIRKKPTTVLDFECNHFLRTQPEAFTNGQPSVEHRLWVEAGKCAPPYPSRPDASYNSNVWRNFRKQFGFSTSAEGRKMSDVIAAMYPLNIPPPSKIGEHTFNKYVTESNLFQDEKFKTLAIKRTSDDDFEMRKLKIKSEARRPPIDRNGNILPPENFKKYVHKFIPPPRSDRDFLSNSPVKKLEDSNYFGRHYQTPYSKPGHPHLWKLTYKLNKTEFDVVQREIEQRKGLNDSNNDVRDRNLSAPSPVSM